MKRAGIDRRRYSNRPHSLLGGLLLLVATAGPAIADPPPGAVAGFNTYIQSVESRLTQQHESRNAFVAPVAEGQLRRGELVIDEVKPSGTAPLPGAILHHWRATAFAPGVTAADFERLMRNFSAYPQRFSPQVVRTSVVAQQGDRMQIVMRVRQKHIITVVMDTAYDVTFGRLDPQHGFSISRSTKIAEIDAPGTPDERELGASEEHGFLWRQNTYWSYVERDGGLYMQVESVSLSRAIPTGLGWAVGPFIESVPRDSLEFTMQATCNALRQPTGHSGQ